MDIDAKVLLNQKNYILQTERIAAIETEEIKENIRLKMGDDTEDCTNRVNGDQEDTNVIEHEKIDQANDDTGFGKVENNKNPSSEGKQHTVGNKLKEDLQITWYKVRFLKNF